MPRMLCMHVPAPRWPCWGRRKEGPPPPRPTSPWPGQPGGMGRGEHSKTVGGSVRARQGSVSRAAVARQQQQGSGGRRLPHITINYVDPFDGKHPQAHSGQTATGPFAEYYGLPCCTNTNATAALNPNASTVSHPRSPKPSPTPPYLFYSMKINK